MSLAGFLGKLTLGLFRFTYVDEGTCKVVTRFGRFKKVLKPGLKGYFSAWGILGRIHAFTVTDPVTLKPVRTTVLDTKEIVFDYPKEKVISKDNVQFLVDAIVYFRVVDPRLALFGVDDYVSALRNTVQSILRAEIARHSLEECYAERKAISDALAAEADTVAKAWGIDVIRLEIQEFDIGAFSEQLLKQKEQEIEKRQEILQAEGAKEAKIREAEATSQAEITVAEGRRIAAASEAAAIKIRAEAEAHAAKLRADAEAYTFRTVAEALEAHPEVLRNYLALHTAEEISKHLAAGQATKLFLPLDFGALVRALASLAERG
ncbi:MAG: SPFH domain-containing protein [Patescibacteria group bacterium]